MLEINHLRIKIDSYRTDYGQSLIFKNSDDYVIMAIQRSKHSLVFLDGEKKYSSSEIQRILSSFSLK